MTVSLVFFTIFFFMILGPNDSFYPGTILFDESFFTFFFYPNPIPGRNQLKAEGTWDNPLLVVS